MGTADKKNGFRVPTIFRYAAIGHSMGGQASVRACQLDDRIKAGANLDGATVDGIFLKHGATQLIKHPFLYAEAPFVPLSEHRLQEDIPSYCKDRYSNT